MNLLASLHGPVVHCPLLRRPAAEPDGALPTDYRALVRDLHRRAAGRRQPLNGTFEITARCPLQCRMCYIRQDDAALPADLPADTWVSLGREAAAHGMVYLTLTGGEVLQRPDFFDLYEPLHDLGLVLTLLTNGTLLSPAIADRLAARPPVVLTISIYGASPETYAAVTGSAGGFEQCCAGIERLLARGLRPFLKLTMTRQNVADLPVLQRMAADWGVQLVAGWMLTKRLDGAPSDAVACRLSPAECIAIEAADPPTATEWAETAKHEAQVAQAYSENYFCHAGKAAFAIGPTGLMSGCADLPLPAARPLETGFAAAWEAVQRFTDDAPPLCAQCRECELLAYCPRCPSWSWVETDTLDQPVPYLCGIARARRARYATDA